MKTNGKTEIELTCQFENNVLLFCHLDNIMRNILIDVIEHGLAITKKH